MSKIFRSHFSNLFIRIEIYLLFLFFLFRSITISSEEYARLLKNEVQLVKYKGLVQNKSSEIKRLQDLLNYYKRKANRQCDNKPDEKDDTQKPITDVI